MKKIITISTICAIGIAISVFLLLKCLPISNNNNNDITTPTVEVPIEDTDDSRKDLEDIQTQTPNDPDTNADPEEPSTPVDPADDQPDMPVIPDEPDVPVIPDEPDVPVVPDEPDVPVVPDEPQVSNKYSYQIYNQNELVYSNEVKNKMYSNRLSNGEYINYTLKIESNYDLGNIQFSTNVVVKNVEIYLNKNQEITFYILNGTSIEIKIDNTAITIECDENIQMIYAHSIRLSRGQEATMFENTIILVRPMTVILQIQILLNGNILDNDIYVNNEKVLNIIGNYYIEITQSTTLTFSVGDCDYSFDIVVVIENE